MRIETRTALKIKVISAIIQPSSFVECPVFKIKIKKYFAGKNVKGKAALNLCAIALC